LIRDVLLLQLKLLLNTARDLVLIPFALAAALADLVQLKTQPPKYFRVVLSIGERTDRWIDVWYSNHDEQAQPRENVDALLGRVEDVVRDPEKGARHARVLKRWTERQLARAKQRAASEMKQISDRNPWQSGK
jgi:hypothetical protein